MTSTIEIQQFSLWDKLRDKRVPLSFDIEVTARCDNDCRHCYINLPEGDKAARERELTVAEIGDIAEQAAKLGAMWCLITGGEPLIRPDFPEIYLMLRRKGLLVSVFTNATMINEGHVALFRKYPPRDVEVTVYGVTRKTYERVTRKPGSFGMFMNGLNMLMNNGVRVRLKAIAIRSNLAEQGAIAAFCREKTKDYSRFDPQLHLRYDGDPMRNGEINAERLTPREVVALERADGERMKSMQQNCSTLINDEFTHQGCDHLFHCGAGNGSFNVGYDGTFRLCSSLCQANTVYDLRKGNLADAWFNFVPRVLDMRSHRKEYLDSCRSCPLVNLCLWCPAHAHLETGELDGATPYFCQVAHARADNLIV
ncbi:MAG TPA: radical SAM protein [Candidatus Wunengus sp. YC60]|uniref:radical SAM protein n=1 Tax=Candidatus Wunengus sp. YC60 TaxID=3367697 RepID=UPI00402915BB